MIDLKSPEFKEELRHAVEEVLETYKIQTLRKEFLTREEFKAEMEKQRAESAKIWQELQNQREETAKIWQEIKGLREDFRADSAKIWQELRGFREDFREDSAKIWQELQNQRGETQLGFKDLGRSVAELGVHLQRMEGKAGVQLERTILDLMRETLRLENVDPDKVRKEGIRDEEGTVFFQGYKSDVDVLVEDGNLYLVEVKATASREDVSHFYQNAKLYAHTHEHEPRGLLLVALRVHQDAVGVADELGMKVITGRVIEAD